jgi:hypothetical protein
MFSLSKKKKIEIGMSQEKDSRSSRWEEETGKSTEENNDNEIVLDGGASSKNTQQQQQQELSEISSTVGISEKDRYKLPNWTGQPPRNTHLDVIKSDRLLNVKV